MGKRFLPLLLASLFLSASMQSQDGPFRKKRKKVSVPNYTLFLQLHEFAVEYATRIDNEVNKLQQVHKINAGHNVFDFRIRAVQTLQYALYRSDPVIGFLDSWVFSVQMINYLETPEAKEYLGVGHSAMKALFDDFSEEFPESYHSLYEDPAIMLSQVESFASEHPISDPHLIRTSIIDETAQWVGEATIGFKSGIATVTDELRIISDRLNYYDEFTPKLVQWNLEQTLGTMIGTDSLGASLQNVIGMIERIVNTLDSLDHAVLSITDTVLTDVDRQRIETLRFMSSERIAIVNQLTAERKLLVNQLIQERLAIENLMQREREASLNHFEDIIRESTVYSFDRIDTLADRLFYRLLILGALMILGMIIVVVIYKKV